MGPMGGTKKYSNDTKEKNRTGSRRICDVRLTRRHEKPGGDRFRGLGLAGWKRASGVAVCRHIAGHGKAGAQSASTMRKN